MDSIRLVVAPYGLIAFASILSFAIATYAYRQIYPRPFPHIPYHRASAEKVFGDGPNMLAEVSKTLYPDKFIFQQTTNLRSPVAQLFLRPFAPPTVIIDDVREVKDILSNRTHEFDRAPRTQDAYRNLLPHCSLVKLTGPAFKAQRKFWEGVMGPPFLRQVAASKIYKSVSGQIELLKTQADVADGRPFDTFDNFDVAAFSLIWEIVFGRSISAIDDLRLATSEAAKTTRQPASKDSPAELPTIRRPEMCLAVSYFISTIAKAIPSSFPRWHLWYLQQSQKYKATLAFKNDTINGLIEETWKDLATRSEPELVKLEESSSIAVGVRRQLLDCIRKGQKPELSVAARDEIHDELFMLLVAGHETKAVLLSWAVKYLIAYPEKQDKLRQALTNALPQVGPGEQPSLQAIMSTSIPYLDAYMEESLRVANTSPRLVRSATCDTEVLGYPIPKGTSVYLNPFIGKVPIDVPEHVRSETSRKEVRNFASHGDPHGMDDFAPERWFAADGAFNPRQFPRLAFSAGPRMCYGRNLSLIEFRITLVLLVLNFRFESLPEGLDSMESQQRLFRMPRQFYIRLTQL